MSEAGYTLLELLVVLAIISLMVGMAPSIYARIVPGFQLRQFANDFSNELRLLRSEARESQKIVGVQIENGGVQVIGSSGDIRLPDGVLATFEPLEMWSTQEETKLLYYPSGHSNGGSVSFSRGQQTVEVHVDWLSGAVKVSG